MNENNEGTDKPPLFVPKPAKEYVVGTVSEVIGALEAERIRLGWNYQTVMGRHLHKTKSNLLLNMAGKILDSRVSSLLIVLAALRLELVIRRRESMSKRERVIAQIREEVGKLPADSDETLSA